MGTHELGDFTGLNLPSILDLSGDPEDNIVERASTIMLLICLLDGLIVGHSGILNRQVRIGECRVRQPKAEFEARGDILSSEPPVINELLIRLALLRS